MDSLSGLNIGESVTMNNQSQQRASTEASAPIRLTAVRVVATDGKILLDVPSLSIASGERVVVLGANGAGKSTLLRVINGLTPATTGEVCATARDGQAFIFHKPPLLHRSVIDNVSFVLRARGDSASAAQSRAHEALEACGLAALANRYARSLSAGEQQRVSLARVWACSPRLLLADEPTANLSPAATREVEQLISSVHSHGATYVISTHSLAQAKRLATRILFLDGGRIIEDQPVDNFFAGQQSAIAGAYILAETF